MDKKGQTDKIFGFQRLFIPGIYLLISVMLGLIAISLTQLIGKSSPEWKGAYLPWAVVVVSLESFYSFRFLQNQKLGATDTGWWLYTLSEWILLALGLRITMFWVNWEDLIRQDLPIKPSFLISSITSYEFILSVFALFIAWYTARLFARNLRDMLVTKEEVTSEISGKMHIARQDIRNKMVNHLLYMGGFMILVVVLSIMDIRIFPWTSEPNRSVVGYLVIYFVLFLVFTAISEYSVHRESWLINKTPFDTKISTRWFLYALLFFFCTGIISLLLPTQYTLSILEIINFILSGIWKSVQFIVELFYAIMQIILTGVAWLMGLMGSQQAETISMPQAMPEMNPPPQPALNGDYPLLDAIKSILFWVVFFALTFFGLRYYLEQNKKVFQWLKDFKVASWIRFLWSSIRQWFIHIGTGIVKTTRESLSVLGKKLIPGQRIENQKPLRLFEKTARVQIILIYGGFIQFMKKLGRSRKPAETPLRFGDSLGKQYWEIHEEISTISQLFQEARYSEHEIDKESSGRMKQAFHQLRAHMKSQNANTPDQVIKSE